MFSYFSSGDSACEETERDAFSSGGGDSSCSYHTSMMRKCMMEDPDGTGEPKMVCKTVKQVFENCPGKPSREVERTETQEDAPEAGIGAPAFGQFDEMFQEFDNMLGPESMLDPRKFLGSFLGLPERFFGFPGDGGFQQEHHGHPHEHQPRRYPHREYQDKGSNGGGFRYQAPHRSKQGSEEDRESARREAHYETNEV